ncbi:MAG TPA: radical SAM protein [Xanthobacteraceae bacterium]|jgi:predicted phosphodiesterase
MSLPNHFLYLDGPVMVFGGPYSNLEATQSLLEQAARLQIPAGRIICTGDLVAYGADAAATVRSIRRAGCHVVMGNCEESLAAGAKDCGCGFPSGSACERLSVAWFTHAIAQLDAEALVWMASLPRRIHVDIGGHRFAVVHGGVERINQFLFASTAASIKDAELDKAGLDGVLAGHCGLPFTQVIGGRLWHNPGAIGLPAHDGTPRVWYSVLTAQAGMMTIEHCALRYDYQTAAAKMRRAGLPEEYAVALESGLWPSCDVLPWKEIRERGVRLEASRSTWQRPAAAPRRRRPARSLQLWPSCERDAVRKLDPRKFRDPHLTAAGAPRASVALRQLKTLWFNTGTLCNIACRNCYIESNPKNDRLVYLTRSEVADFLDEIARDGWPTEEIGFTGGEPFMNPDLFGMLEDCLSRDFRVLVLTNAMQPMQRSKGRLLELNRRLGRNLTIRVSLDHFTAERHEDERGPGTFKPALDGLVWLGRNSFRAAVAGRTMWGEDEASERRGYARLFTEYAIPLNADDPADLVLFPEMDARADVAEITTACWAILHKSPSDVMCSSSRMVIKRRGSERPSVVPCTLLPYDPRFELGARLKEAGRTVALNHPHCARFCVLGGASCSAPTGQQFPSPDNNPPSHRGIPEAVP